MPDIYFAGDKSGTGFDVVGQTLNMGLTTPQKARIFSQYYGCDTQVVTSIDSETGMPSHGWITGIMEGCQLELQMAQGHHASETPEYYDFDVCALMLRSPLNITDEHADMLSKVALPGPDYDHLHGAPIGKKIAQTIAAGRQNNMFYTHARFSDAIEYLKSQGYAVPIYPYDKTAIELGLAIEMPA